MVTEAPTDPQLVAEQSMQHITDLEHELMSTISSHVLASFSKQEHLLRKQLQSLQQIDEHLEQLLEQVKNIAHTINTETDSVVHQFLASGASAVADPPAANASPVTRSRARTGRKRTRLSQGNN